MNWFIGNAGYAFFDYWTIIHLSFWIFIGSCIAAVKLNRHVFGLLSLSTAIMWEIFERFAEKKWPEIWMSPESWWNAWLSDPLTVVIGFGIAFIGFDHWRGIKK